MRVVPASQWRLLPWRAVPTIPTPTGELWIHHGAAGTANLATLRGYERYHVVTLGWAAPGYNWAVTADGTIYELRGWGRQGAHTRGRNRISHAILLVGNWTSGRVPDAMVESVAWLVRDGHRRGALATPTISGGHRQAPGQSTACPGAAGLAAVDRARVLLRNPQPRPAPQPDPQPDPEPPALEEQTVKQGDRGAHVAWWQGRINEWVRWRNEYSRVQQPRGPVYGMDPLKADGVFGPLTRGAVGYVQRHMGLEGDGVTPGVIDLTTASAIVRDIGQNRQRVHSIRSHA